MNKYRAFVTLLIALLLLFSLGISTRQAKAYGNSIITVNCPTITVSATSDHPITADAIGPNRILVFTYNLTTGGGPYIGFMVPTRSEYIVTPVGSWYIRYYYESTWSLRTSAAGENYYIQLRDQTGLVGEIRFTCNSSTYTSNSNPSGYTLMTIICPSYIFTSPGGSILPPYSSVADPIPEVGKQRYVLPVGRMGPDGQLYDKIQAYAFTFGYFPRRCLG